MARRGGSPWGWHGPARGLLVAMAYLLSTVLAWVSSIGDSSEAAILPSLIIDANTAPAEVFNALPGLGPALTRRIVAAREVAPFRSIDDFDRRVRGVGPAKIAAIRPFLRFDGDSSPALRP